jgi:flagellar motor switch protein FliM
VSFDEEKEKTEEEMLAEWESMAEEGEATDKGEDETVAEWEAMASQGESEGDSGGSQERILNQDEIDSLLGFDAEGGNTPNGWKVLIDSRQISYERLPMLEVVFDRLVRLLSTSLRNFTSENVDVSLSNMTSARFGDYLDRIPLPTLIGVFKSDRWGTWGLLTMDTALIYAIVDSLLGGRKTAGGAKIEGRPFTSIEQKLVERLLCVVLEDFSSSFAPVEPVTFSFERMETNPRFATIVRPVNAAIVVRLHLEIENCGGHVEFLIPYSSLEPVREKLLQMFMGEKTGQDDIWLNHFGQEVWQANVTLEAVLDRVTVPLGDVLNWKKGSFLDLRAKPESPVLLFSGDKLVMRGRTGQRNRNIALQVDENFLEEEEKEAI